MTFMNDLFKKLNVLLKASLKDAVGGGGERQLAPVRLGKGVDREITALRDRINEAVRYEDEIKARIRRYEDEAERWDQEADAAVARDDNTAARYAIEHMQRAQQRASIAQSDLREHQRSTQDLIGNVNTLDAAVADARRAHPEATAGSSLPDLANVLREAREKITSLGEIAAASTAAPNSSLETPLEAPASTPERLTENPPESQSTNADAAVDDDLERRRQRLSKR